MADLRDREVAVSDKNDERMGPSGRRARSAKSFYLEVGGSKDTYNVTVNFEHRTPSGQWEIIGKNDTTLSFNRINTLTQTTKENKCIS